MKTLSSLLAILMLLGSARAGYGMAMEKIGPVKSHAFPPVDQPGWPSGMIKVLVHDARVYSVWVNGNENFYFKASPAEIAELIRCYSQIHLRDHVLTIKQQKQEVCTFKGVRIDYNINYHFLGGIALAMMRRKAEAETYDPTFTIFVDPAADRSWWKDIVIPGHVVVNSEVEDWPIHTEASIPDRKVWHAEVNFGDSTPAVDFKAGLVTKVTLWEKDADAGFDLGKIGYKGQFHVAFSEKEIADLRAERTWMTLTVGNQMTAAKKVDSRLNLEDMSTDASKVNAVEIAKPGLFFGRLLFEDGSPAVLEPRPWPGAEIAITFPYAGRFTVDKKGYFGVFFTPEQFEAVKEKRVRKNVYIPYVLEKGRATARYAFPASILSPDREKAGEIRIQNPYLADPVP
jgi:hypothetical protein